MVKNENKNFAYTTHRIGGTTYKVNTHFSKKGSQSVLEQFKELILSENLI